MENKNSTKRIAAYACLATFALMCILMLLFSTLSSVGEAAKYVDISDNGFTWMAFDTNFAGGSTWDAAAVPLGILSIAQLIWGIIAVAMVGLNFAKGKDKSNTKIIAVGLVSMALYAIEGIVASIMYDNDYIGTYAYLPIIIGIVLVIAYVVVLKCMPGEFGATNTSGAKATAPKSATTLTEAERIESLAKYNDLLAKGVISQEEFNEKKKQLLDL